MVKYRNKPLYALLFLLCGLTPACSQPDGNESSKPQRLTAACDINTECVGIVLDLSGLGQYVVNTFSYGDKQYRYMRMIRDEFAPYSDHPAVKKARELTDLKLLHYGFYYYAVYHSPFPEFERIHPLDSGFYGTIMLHDSLERHYREFDSLLRDFYRDAQVQEFYTHNRDFYRHIEEEVQSTLPVVNLTALDSFYGTPKNRCLYRIIPSPTLPIGFNFGPSLQDGDNCTFYYLCGPSFDTKPFHPDSLNGITETGFLDSVYLAETALHEFGHSYVRFLDKPEMKASIDTLEFLNASDMQKRIMEYGQSPLWRNVFEEHLVRASEIVIWKQLGDSTRVERKLSTDQEEGFWLLPRFIVLLETYTRQRDRYPNLEAYMEVLFQELNEGTKKSR